MKVLTEENCPHCKKSFESSHDMDNLEPKINKGTIKQIQGSGGQTVQEVKPEVIEKEIVKTVSPADVPFFPCKDGNCGEIHKNPNYSKAPNKKCKNCDTLNGVKKCKNCQNSDPEEFEEIDNEELTEMGIPLPPEDKHEGHDHE